MPSIAMILVLAAPAADESLWDVFARSRIPSAASGEDTGGLEATLETLQTQDRRCRERLSKKDALGRRVAVYRADRETAAIEAGFDEAAFALKGVDPEVTITPRETPGPQAFAVTLSGTTPSRASATVAMASALIPTLDVERLEIGPTGWTATARMSLLTPRPQSEDVADAPAPGPKERRRSSELRLRVAAARPLVLDCQRKLAEAGLVGYAWFVNRAGMPRPRGGAVRPVLEALSQARYSGPATIEALADGYVGVSVPASLEEEATQALAVLLSHVGADGTTEGERHVYRLALERPLASWLSREGRPKSDRLAAFRQAYAELQTARSSIAYLADPTLEAPTQAAFAAADAAWPVLVELESVAARTEALLARRKALGVVETPEAFRDAAAACGVKLEGKAPAADGKVWTVTLTSPHPDDGPHPFACLRTAVAGLKFVRFEWSGRVSRGTAKVSLPAPSAPVEGVPSVLPPTVEPRGDKTSPEIESLRAKIAAITRLIEEARPRLPETAEYSRQWGELRRLAQVPRPSPGAARFYDVVFADAARIGLWVDFTARSEVFDLNVNPKERSRGLIDALAAAGCTAVTAKDVAGGYKATYDCAPR